jgi:hypothetical protein
MVLPEGTTAEIERVVGTMAEERPDAVLVTGEGDQYAHRQLIVELAGKTRLPALYATGDYVERGGLMGYVADDAEARRILVDDVHQIFTGVKPGDIPIYQNAQVRFGHKFENRQSARANVAGNDSRSCRRGHRAIPGNATDGTQRGHPPDPPPKAGEGRGGGQARWKNSTALAAQIRRLSASGMSA